MRLYWNFITHFGGISVLKNINAKGLLCGAWGYTFCLNYRAFAWRIDSLVNQSTTNSINNALIVLGFTLVISFMAFMYSLIISYPNRNK